MMSRHPPERCGPPARRLGVLLALVASLAASPSRADEPVDPPGRVARVNLTLGTVSVAPAGSDSWVADVLNRPLTTGDRLWVDRESRAELHVGSAAVRLGSETGLEFLNLDDRTIQLRLTAGTLELRVRALGSEQTFEIATPSAAISVLQAGDYRIDVNDAGDDLRIAAVRGQLAVTGNGREDTVNAGDYVDYAGTLLGEPMVNALPPGDAFDQWSNDRDRREDRALAARYVSREMTGYEDLGDYGSWNVDDQYGPVWRPVVSAGWAPYRVGYWAWVAPWGWSWVDAAPWGFAPFHYGRWLFVRGGWCWAPGPHVVRPVYAPALVGWVGGANGVVGVAIGGGPAIGWFPLGWNEVYVPAYGVSTVYVRAVNVTNTHVTPDYVNTYVVNNTTIVDGAANRPGTGDRGIARPGAMAVRYANQSVPGAVTATSRTAFTTAQPVAQHLASVPRETLERAVASTAAPAIAPVAQSVGRPAPFAPRVAPELWSRPVVARAPPPPAPVPFEQQRRAVVANGGLPPAPQPAARPRTDRPPASFASASPRADVIRSGSAAQRPTATPARSVEYPAREARAVAPAATPAARPPAAPPAAPLAVPPAAPPAGRPVATREEPHATPTPAHSAPAQAHQEHRAAEPARDR
jgi:hypothetical protein